MPPIIITGAGGGVSVRERLEIHDFVKIEDQFSLYIQALDAMYKEKQDYKLSHFGISGIHGLPYEPWGESNDGDNGPSSKPEQWEGYCTHGSVLFPTWHRLYVALYEQVLQQHAIEIAKKYVVDSARWMRAAQDLRAPYWDWARNIVPPPEVTSKATLDILMWPNGELATVENPLLQYTFNPIHKSFYEPWASWKNTLRRPTSEGPDAKTDVEALERVLQARQKEIQDDAFNLIFARTWQELSNNTSSGPRKSNINSLEAMHDKIHFYIGGHMRDSAVAGFDPIFYLLHAGVDQLLAIWSTFNPYIWVTEGSAESGTWTIPVGSVVDKDTNLTPFLATESKYWTSADVMATSKLGYTYPGLDTIKPRNQSSTSNEVPRHINSLYGGSLLGLFGASGPATSPAQLAAPVTAAPVFPHGVRNWAASIRIKKYQLGHSFAVLIFLGDVPADPGEWLTSPNLVGTHVAFVNSAADKCANCRAQVDTETEGFLDLNSAIASQLSQTGFVDSVEPDVVLDYLRKNLHCRVQSADGSPIEISTLTFLKVAVSAFGFDPDPGAVDGDPTFHHDTTQGRPGSARPAPA